jgi:hypothetical protein
MFLPSRLATAAVLSKDIHLLVCVLLGYRTWARCTATAAASTEQNTGCR